MGDTGKALQRVARLPRSSKIASPTGTIGHQALGCGDHCSDSVGHYILCHTCIMHSWCAFTQAQPIRRHTTQMKTYSHPVPASTTHPPSLTQSHLSVRSGRAARQAGSRHPLSTDVFIQPQNCSRIIYSCSLAQQDLSLKSAGLWLSRRNKEVILHAVCPQSLRENGVGEKVHRDFRHSCYPSTLRHLETEGEI